MKTLRAGFVLAERVMVGLLGFGVVERVAVGLLGFGLTEHGVLAKFGVLA